MKISRPLVAENLYFRDTHRRRHIDFKFIEDPLCAVHDHCDHIFGIAAGKDPFCFTADRLCFGFSPKIKKLIQKMGAIVVEHPAPLRREGLPVVAADK